MSKANLADILSEAYAEERVSNSPFHLLRKGLAPLSQSPSLKDLKIKKQTPAWILFPEGVED